MTSGIKKVCTFFLCLRIYLFKIINNSSSLSNEIRDRDDVWTSDLRPRQHVSGYFLIRNFVFPDSNTIIIISQSTRYRIRCGFIIFHSEERI